MAANLFALVFLCIWDNLYEEKDMKLSSGWLLSVVAPVYNEEEGIRKFYQKLSSVMRRAEISAEIIFVNDGSRDKSGEILKDIQKNDGAVKLLEFSRNFGHQIAVKAG